MSEESSCFFCRETGGEILYRTELLRMILPADAEVPGTCRVILERHAREMTDLSPVERAAVMEAVFAVEKALREVLRPDKVNLASFGNLVPHVHWHVIPRFEDDAFFPNPVWGARSRATAPRALPGDLAARLRCHLEL